MDKNEPSLVPGWLKGGGGNSVGNGAHVHRSHQALYHDGGRNRGGFNNGSNSHSEHNSPRFSLADRTVSSSTRSLKSSSSFTERSLHLKDNQSQSRPSSSSSSSSYSTCNRISEVGGHNRDVDWDPESSRDFTDENRGKEREHMSNGGGGSAFVHNDSGSVLLDKHSLTRSQSVDLRNRKGEASIAKPVEVMNSKTAFPTSMQKTSFERNFPSLNAQERKGGGSSMYSSLARTRLWHGSVKVDGLRSLSSSALAGGSSCTALPSPGNATMVVEGWTSALADGPIIPKNDLGSLTSAASTHANSLNMAEAVVQNPPRVSTSPQPALEAQRLEELALKQSRQLIPVTPSLPKTMSTLDKAKTKPQRMIDVLVPSISNSKGNQHSGGSLQRINTVSKPAQGKLLVLKSAKEGVGPAVADSRLGINGVAATPASNLGAPKQISPTDRWSSAPSSPFSGISPDGLRSRDGVLLEDKRISSQAQNRNDFFNSLRRKAASNGAASLRENNDESKGKCKGENLPARENGLEHGLSPQSDREIELEGASLDEDRSLVGISASTKNSGESPRLMAGSEEEEAAFLRSLGWEENADEGEALTEEEINAFHQMRERTGNVNGTTTTHRLRSSRFRHPVGSVESMASGLSSSDSESDADFPE